MPQFMDLTGQRFGRLLVVSRHTNQGKKVRWLCRCDCGRSSAAFAGDLRSGHHRSCGCLHIETVTRHGASRLWRTKSAAKTPEYVTWLSMKARCGRPGHSTYYLYGARGISVCPRWLASFEAFLDDMGRRPEGHTLDRIDVNGDYSPENCRWATRREQMLNRRPVAEWKNPPSYRRQAQ